MMRMFEVDLLDECIEKLRTETQIGMQHDRDDTLAHLQ